MNNIYKNGGNKNRDTLTKSKTK